MAENAGQHDHSEDDDYDRSSESWEDMSDDSAAGSDDYDADGNFITAFEHWLEPEPDSSASVVDSVQEEVAARPAMTSTKR